MAPPLLIRICGMHLHNAEAVQQVLDDADVVAVHREVRPVVVQVGDLDLDRGAR